MDKLIITALEKEISKQLNEKKDEIGKAILSSCKETDSMEKIYVKMIINAIEISVKMSTSFILGMLIGSGLVIPRDEEQIRRNIFSIVK